jgi:hypothetical protein
MAWHVSSCGKNAPGLVLSAAKDLARSILIKVCRARFFAEFILSDRPYLVHWLIFRWCDVNIGNCSLRVVAELGRVGAICNRALGVYVTCFTLSDLSHCYLDGSTLWLKRFFAYA